MTQQSTPLRLFKYLGTEVHHLKVLEDLAIRFTPPGDLNDLHDCIPAVMPLEDIPSYVRGIVSRNQLAVADLPSIVVDHAVSEMIKTYEADPSIPMSKIKSAVIRNLNAIGVLSLSEDLTNELMWAHYANGHRGFAIEFDSNSSFFSGRDTDAGGEGVLTKVIYSDQRVQVRADELELPSYLLFMKSNSWAYEKEWRVIRRLAACDTHIDRRGGASPIALCTIPPSAFKRIIVGAAASDELVEAIQQMTSPGTLLAQIPVDQVLPGSSSGSFSVDRLS